jgi:parvulin-like peptidyl-prolyl isomerase
MQKNMGNRSGQLKNLDENQLRDNINRFANYLGERRLLLTEASKENVSTSKAQIDSVLKLHFQRTGGEEKFLKLLDKNGQSIEDIKNDVRIDQTIQKYINDVIIAGIKINEDDIKKAYQEDKAATVRHILLSTKGKSDSEKKQIKEKMEDILVQAKNGKDFAELAKQYSEDPGSKAKGGLYKDIRRGQMVKPFEDAAFSTPIGEISEVFETRYGFHILTVLERKKETRPFEEVRKELENKMKQQRKREAFQQRLSDLKEQYEYEVIQY